MQLQVSPAVRAMKPDSITTIRQFVVLCDKATNDEIFHMFEDGPCTQKVRNAIYDLAPDDASEPFRAAMNHLGFPDY